MTILRHPDFDSPELASAPDAKFVPAPADGVLPEGFFSTTNLPTYVRIKGTWRMPREEYFALHGLDPSRKLLSYACSFVTFSPNYQNIAALAKLVNSGHLAEPAQLLIRLHPNHFMPGSLYEKEAERVRELVRTLAVAHTNAGLYGKLEIVDFQASVLEGLVLHQDVLTYKATVFASDGIAVSRQYTGHVDSSHDPYFDLDLGGQTTTGADFRWAASGSVGALLPLNGAAFAKWK